MVLTYMIPYMYLNLSDEKVGASFLLAFELRYLRTIQVFLSLSLIVLGRGYYAKSLI